MDKKGFTLVELMVVIAVIGILAASLFPAFWNYFERARKTDAKSKMRQISQLVLDAQIIQWKFLKDITTSGCSNCPCSPNPPYNNNESLINISETHQCFTNWKRAIDNVALATWNSTWSVERYYRDPWGAPYLLDENEGEWYYDSDRCDRLASTLWWTQTSSGWRYSINLQRSAGDVCR